MRGSIDEFEEDACRLINEILSDNMNALEMNGFTSERVKLKKGELDQASSSSEIEVTFWDGDDLKDIIEFPVFRGGKKISELDEIGRWFNEQLREIVRKRT